MHDLYRNMKGELDSKMRALQVLIGQANEAADRLQSLLALNGQRSGGDVVESSAGKPQGQLPASAALREKIYAFADSGRSSTEIAAELGTPVGEVELVLSLRTARSS